MRARFMIPRKLGDKTTIMLVRQACRQAGRQADRMGYGYR